MALPQISESPQPVKELKRCIRCISDTTIPEIRFDAKGECNFCKLHDKMEKEYPLDEKGRAKFQNLLGRVKRDGTGKEYDCVVGISGGRDSTYALYLAKKAWGLRPLAVHFNDGFGNPVAGENMRKATQRLGVKLITITSDWRESKDLKIAFLKASTPELEEGTDLGIATALYGVAAKENIKHVLIGQSFRTEGITPLSWNYLDGIYLKAVHKRYGKVKLRGWSPNDPGFNLNPWHMLYYTVFRGIRTFLPLYYTNYVRPEAEKILISELDWKYPGAHYYDDLYQSLIFYVYRVKFNIDRRLFNYSALVRSGQMSREEALEKVKHIYVIEDPKVIDLCIKRLGITREEFDTYLGLPPKTFRDYPNGYWLIALARPAIKMLCLSGILPRVTYDKYFSAA
ncbi:MAG: N-acetyl sugar amidotransferase [Bdellovibrionales bacterium]|nr:N-acetyl sugar amidotransferase [Bdellovibrionales bacterium]